MSWSLTGIEDELATEDVMADDMAVVDDDLRNPEEGISSSLSCAFP
jgi:hypothetical protein